MMVNKESGTERERKSIGRVDNEEEHGKTASVDDCRFGIHHKRLRDVRVIQLCEDSLCTKRLSGPNRGYDFFGDCSSFSDMLQ